MHKKHTLLFKYVFSHKVYLTKFVYCPDTFLNKYAIQCTRCEDKFKEQLT